MLSEVSEAPQTIGRALRFDWRRYVVFIAFLVILAFFSITLYDAGFLSVTNLLNIVLQSAIIAVMAVAMTFVICAAEIDLSVGSVGGRASVTSALAVSGYGLLAGIVAGLLTGIVVGGINGLLVAAIGIPSFLVTLGIAHGSAMWVTSSAPVPILNDAFNSIFGSGQLGPVPSLLIWVVVMLVIGYLVLRKTTYGRQVLATGGNEAAARLSGVNTRRIKFYVLLVSGIRRVAGWDALRWATPFRTLLVWRGRLAVGDSSRDTGWHEPVRGYGHGHRVGARCAAGWPYQQRVDPIRIGVEPAGDHTRSNHHFGCRPRPQIEKSSSRGSEPQVKPKKEER